MLHRAPFGSMERFVAILLEHTGGLFPLWLATTQVEILIVSENFKNYGQKVLNILENHEIRAHLDDRNCLLYTSPSPRDLSTSRMPSSA